MKKLFFILAIFSLSLIGANATEQDTVDRSATTIREFRHMPEKGIPSRILRNARGLAIISVLKAGFIFSGKAGEGVVVARPDMAGRVHRSSAPAARVGDRRSARK